MGVTPQRLHAYLLHEGWPCSRSNLLRPPGLRWATALQLSERARLQVDSLLSVMAALEAQLDTVDAELRRFARADECCLALQSIYGIGPILACHLLVEIGQARRFRRAAQITRLAGLDPVVDESGETRRRGLWGAEIRSGMTKRPICRQDRVCAPHRVRCSPTHTVKLSRQTSNVSAIGDVWGFKTRVPPANPDFAQRESGF